jgi:hypothetical protein
MAEANEGWNELGDRLSSLGLKLRLHWEQSQGEEKEAAGDALNRLRDAIEDAFDAVGTAAKDPAMQDDVRQTGQALVKALSESFSQVSENLQEAMRRR